MKRRRLLSNEKNQIGTTNRVSLNALASGTAKNRQAEAWSPKGLHEAHPTEYDIAKIALFNKWASSRSAHGEN